MPETTKLSSCLVHGLGLIHAAAWRDVFFFYVSLNSSPAKLEFDAVVLGAATRRPRLWFLLIRKDSLRVDDAVAAVSEFFPKLVKAGAALPEKTSNLDQGRLLQSNFAAGST